VIDFKLIGSGEAFELFCEDLLRAKGLSIVKVTKGGLVHLQDENGSFITVPPKNVEIAPLKNNETILQRPTPQGMPCPTCNGRGVGSHNSDGLPNTCTVCLGTGTAPVA
jgi:hypothetical protein